MLHTTMNRMLPALVIALALFVTACGSDPQAGVVEVWTTWASMPRETLALFDRFSQETGLQVQVKTGVKGDKIAGRLADGTPPDLLLLSSNDPVAALDEQGLIAPLDEQSELSTVDLADIYPAALAQCTAGDGRLLCLPWGGDVQVLYWNKALFRAAGLDPERPPASTEEVLELAMKLTRRDDAGRLSQVGFIPDLPGSHSELFAHLSAGAQAGRAPAVDAASLQAALAWQGRFFDFYDPGQLEAFVASFTPHRTNAHPVFAGARLGCQQCHRANPLDRNKAPVSGFLDGQVAMMVDGGWLVSPGVRSAVQELVDFGVGPFPAAAAAPDRANTTLVQGPVLVIPTAAVDRAPAGQLLAWLSAPETLAEAALHNGLLPSSRAAARDPAFHQSPEQEMLLDLLAGPTAAFHPLTPQAPSLNALLADAEDIVFHTDQSPATIVDQIAPEMP